MSFLQSEEWERFQQSVGRETWRLNHILVIQHVVAPSGLNYLYCPRPQLAWSDTEPFLSATRLLARSERSIFLKIDRAERAEELSSSSFVCLPGRAAHSLQPSRTIILDVLKSEEELLHEMRQKTRYNIRLAEKKGVHIKTIIHRDTQEDMDIFLRLMQETTARNSFHAHKEEYYRKLISTKSSEFSNELFFAEYRGAVCAAALVNFFCTKGAGGAGSATYLHGASTRDSREVMAPHLLQWHIMKEAQARGCTRYDLWGIDEKKWPGLTRFKRGFGGQEIQYAPTIDVAYKPLSYWAYRLGRMLR